jgi:hypothetical protein
MAVLIIYDGWEQLRSWNVVTVIVGPLLAIFLSHVFGAALGSRVALGRPLTRHEHRTVFAEECRFLLLAVPPLVILVILAAAGVSYTRIIEVIVLTGVLSLAVIPRGWVLPRPTANPGVTFDCGACTRPPGPWTRAGRAGTMGDTVES